MSRSGGLSCPVFVPDLPGFGCSPGPREVLGMEDLADWTARLMETLGVTRAHLAGNSMGCQVALALARRQPERVGAGSGWADGGGAVHSVLAILWSACCWTAAGSRSSTTRF